MESMSSVTLFIPTKGRGEGESGVERGGGLAWLLFMSPWTKHVFMPRSNNDKAFAAGQLSRHFLAVSTHPPLVCWHISTKTLKVLALAFPAGSLLGLVELTM